MPIRPGLLSVTFRGHTPREIIQIASRDGLQGIEWGGDVHVPPGNLPLARTVRGFTEDAGLEVAAYGSYYCAGVTEDGSSNSKTPSFEAVLDTARELRAPSIRVWAGANSSADLSEAERGLITADLCRITALAAESGIAVATEYHAQTLTDTPESVARLLRETAHTGLQTLWQPAIAALPQSHLASLEAVLPRLLNLHVYQWQQRAGQLERLPLAVGRAEWTEFLRLATTTGRPHWAMLEFVRDDAPEQAIEDGQTLNEIIAALSG
jgi:3-dehydroshikimate dehydratase